MCIFLLFLSSCEKLTMPDDEENVISTSKEKQKISIVTRSLTNDIHYPVTVYAFTEDGKCAAQQTLKSSSDDLSISLSPGKYSIAALCNTDGYELPTSPSSTSTITFKKEGNFATSPLQMGQANISVSSTSQTVNLVMSYRVTPLNISLTDVPSSVSAVSVSVSQQYSALNLKGEYSSSKQTVIPLEKSGDKWVASAYLFPGSSSQTIFSISLTSSLGTSTYGYTYSKPLQSSTPYNLSGNYSTDIIRLSGVFSAEGWSEPVTLDFAFGPGSSSGGDLPSETVSEYPLAGTLWQNHIVAYAYDDMGNIIFAEQMNKLPSVNLLLLSVNEWTKVKSAYNDTNPEESAEIASSYIEGDLSGWTIPTVAEASNMSSLHNVTFEETLDALNTTISSIGGDVIIAMDDNEKNIRYLCDDGKSTFVWRRNPDVRSAGASTKYSLRLVNHVKVTK